jgi:hypothetical protein
LLVRLGGDREGAVADRELGLAEEGSGFGLRKRADPLADCAGDQLREFVGELLGGAILLGSRRLLPENLTDKEGGFLGKTPGLSFVYKNSTNFRDAHTGDDLAVVRACTAGALLLG